MVVAAGNLVSSVTCAIHVQRGLNLVSAGTNGVSGSQTNIFEASFMGRSCIIIREQTITTRKCGAIDECKLLATRYVYVTSIKTGSSFTSVP